MLQNSILLWAVIVCSVWHRLIKPLHSWLSPETELSLDCLWLTTNCKYHKAAEEGANHYFISHCKYDYKLHWWDVCSFSPETYGLKSSFSCINCTLLHKYALVYRCNLHLIWARKAASSSPEVFIPLDKALEKLSRIFFKSWSIL